MSRCNFCEREFQNPQAVKAHLRWCPNYEKPKNGTAMRTQPMGPSLSSSKSLYQGHDAPNERVTPSNSFAGLVEEFTRQFAGPDEATRLKQKREALLAGLCSSLVDWYHPLEGVMTPNMAVVAKVAILDELGAMAIEDMPQAELTLRGTAIRYRVFAPYFQRQHEQRERQQEQLKQDTRRSQRDAAIQLRQLKRKAALIELGVTRALKSASSRGLTGRALTLLEWEVRARLETLLVGDETEHQVEETIAASIERPLLEWAVRIEQAQTVKRERMLEQCLALALPVAQAAWPWMKDAVITRVCETFGVQPPPQPSSPRHDEGAASEKRSPPTDSDAPTPRPVRRRRMRPSGPIVNQNEMVRSSEPAVSEPLTRDRAAS